MSPRILVIGANGQIGTDLASALAVRHGADAVVLSDIAAPASAFSAGLTHHILDATDASALQRLVSHQGINQIYLLAAALSARGEQHPAWAWDLNMKSLLNVLEVARTHKLDKVFWPSSIAAFGPNTRRNHGVDVRSIRYPGLISWKTAPGGGTTDYAIEIFHAAVRDATYTSFLAADTALPMMYMDDAIRATLELMDAPTHQVNQCRSYNLAGISLTPRLIAAEIAKHIPGFTLRCEPDFRQTIADSWPRSIDDSQARADWGWTLKFDTAAMVEAMLANISRSQIMPERTMEPA